MCVELILALDERNLLGCCRGFVLLETVQFRLPLPHAFLEERLQLFTGSAGKPRQLLEIVVVALPVGSRE